MKKIGLIVSAALLIASCNNSATETSTSDSTAKKDNTNVYDTGMGSSMADTTHRMDTVNSANKMQDTGSKK